MAKAEREDVRESVVRLVTIVLRDRTVSGGPEAPYRKLLSSLLWQWTEADGKWSRSLPWSRSALETDNRRSLRHEHVVPRKLLIDALVAMGDPEPRAVRDILERMAVACIVTEEEHRRLPDVPWADLSHDVWVRYRRAGVEVRPPES
ncbi:MAG: hypothetical protein KDE27_16730 [Planctomycetes bacterium]|nr:hypothetical protein [Planctomycetota bacterium]